MAQVFPLTQLILAKEKDVHHPGFEDLDKLKKSVLVNKLRHQWPTKTSLHSPDQQQKPQDLVKILRELSAGYRQHAEASGQNCLSRFAVGAFQQTTDLLGPHPHGIPNVNEAILLTAEFVLRLSKPVLAKHGFREDIAGVAQLDQLIADSLGEPTVFEAAAQYHYELCFGRLSDLKELSDKEAFDVKNTHHLVWVGVLANKTPVVASYMSYIHHLALPPAERCLRSFARTIAFVDAILANLLHRLRQSRATFGVEARQDQKERVVWIMNAVEAQLLLLASENYFEDAAAFRGEREHLTIYMISNFTSLPTWTCGTNVKVHIVHYTSYADLPKPELVFIFNTSVEDSQALHQFAIMANMQRSLRPVLVITCRCEAEARRLREVLDCMGLVGAWPLPETPGRMQRDSLFVRNLYSGMASDPDIEYDENGWVAAVFLSKLEEERLVAWTDSREYFDWDIKRLLDLNKQRVKWTEGFLNTAYEVKSLVSRCGKPHEGDEFTAEHLLLCQEAFDGRWECSIATLIDMGNVEVMSPEEAAALDAKKQSDAAAGEAEAAEAQQPRESRQEAEAEEEADYRVIYSRVIMRSEPSTKSATVGVHQQGSVVRGVVVTVEGDKWLRISLAKAKNGSGKQEAREAWMLLDGSKLGLGPLLERTTPPARESKEKQPEAVDQKGAPAKGQRSERSPAVFWGILDLKYDPGRGLSGDVKVLETGDGRLSRFSGCGASIKESFQHEHKLEETLRRAVLTENKKLTHDVIVDHNYGHLRPRQLEFRKEYTPDLAGNIQEAFSLKDEDICVLKLCNRTRGAGVIPVYVAELDQVLQQLLEPPADMQEWFREQPRDWALNVTTGCFEEQKRHWWSNECPAFLVEEFCISMLTEKEGRYFDGTMRVGFSLHRELRNKLPRGWVDSPDGPVRVQVDGDDGTAARSSAPMPWNDDRRYLDLFRADTSFLRVQWLGGYWKLPIEDFTSHALRDKVVSVAKQGTAPVPEITLQRVYAALGHMVSLLFGSNDMSQQAIRARYKAFPELAAFAIARLACSVRSADRAKSLQLMELAQMYTEKQSGICKDCVASYIQRNLGVAEAARRVPQWPSAAGHFKQSMQALPTNANSLHLLGLHHLELGDPLKAAEQFELALLLDPDFKAPYACLGVALLRKGQYERAAAVSAAGLARHPYTPACHYNWGVASFALAVVQEQETGAGHIASELRARALVELEAARDQRFLYQPWELQDDTMVAQLRNEGEPLPWGGRRLPRDGWRVMGWRP